MAERPKPTFFIWISRRLTMHNTLPASEHALILIMDVIRDTQNKDKRAGNAQKSII